MKEYKNIQTFIVFYFESKFTSQTQKKYKNTKLQTCLQGLLPGDMSFQSSVQKYILPKCFIAKIRH